MLENDFFIALSPRMIEKALSNLKQITFEVTDICNLKCKYCGYGEFYEDYDLRRSGNLSVQKGIVILNYLSDYWKSNLNTSYSQSTYVSFYGGEPLLNIDFIKEIVSYIESLQIPRKRFKFSMTTNAMLLDKYMDYLVDKDFKILISLDGNSYNHGYRITYSGKNSFDKIFSNVKILQKKYPDFFESNVNFNAVLHNRNSVSEIYQFIQNEFCKTPRIAELSNTGIRKEEQKQFLETYRNKYESLHSSKNFEQINEDLFIESPETAALGIFLHQHSGNVFRSYSDLLDNKIQKKILPTGTCIPFSKKMFVTVNGKILPCEHIGHQFGLGVVTDRKVFLDFKTIASKYNNWYNKVLVQCSRCSNTKACTQCVFNLDDLNENPVCKGYMNAKHFNQYASIQLEYLRKHPSLYKRIMEDVVIR